MTSPHHHWFIRHDMEFVGTHRDPRQSHPKTEHHYIARSAVRQLHRNKLHEHLTNHGYQYKGRAGLAHVWQKGKHVIKAYLDGKDVHYIKHHHYA